MPFDTLWCFLLSEQSPCSHSEHLQHGHPCSLFIAKLSNFWNMMAASGIQMLVSWYDSGYLSMYSVFTLWTKSIFTFGTPATQTPVFVAKSSNLYKIWWQLPVFRRWYRDMMLVSFDTLLCSVQSMQSPSSHSEHLHHGHPCSLQNYLISKRWWRFFVFRCRYRDMILGTFRYNVMLFTV